MNILRHFLSSAAVALASVSILPILSAREISRAEALDFLKSTLSLPDRTDYSDDFYLENVDASLTARREMPWGKMVPDREFLHFVLPVRVNNENLDSSRMVFYRELKPRLEGLSMEEAILEVNHWCHEKVTYRPSDGRTSSPLSAVSQAIGRCGEESTFTVAALRAVGIPARQIYTPRWAHTDDNHAWVEAWADGKWHFIGACEPEPVLDLAWFNEPASRGLLMTTNVPGDYNGPEEMLAKDNLITRINVTENYAPTTLFKVKVTHPDGKPAVGAKVDFCIYNYAEYYPAVTRVTDSLGIASLSAGLGDLVAWASDGSRFGMARLTPSLFTISPDTAVNIVVDKDASFSGSLNLDIVPPKASVSLPRPSEKAIQKNALRSAKEDSIRNAYTATFFSVNDVPELSDLGIENVATAEKILTESRGNHTTILATLKSLPTSDRDRAVALLANVSEKDRRDITADVIVDHLSFTPRYDSLQSADLKISDEVYDRYVLNPRIELEYLRPWRGVLSHLFSPEEAIFFRSNPDSLAAWVDDNIKVTGNDNPQGLRMSPAAVIRAKVADRLSRNIFFVALARTLGIPSRIDPVTGQTQVLNDDMSWSSVDFKGDRTTGTEEASAPSGALQLTFKPGGYLTDPVYYSHFTISKMTEGRPRLLEFPEGATLSSIFSKPYPLEAGQYVITSGERLANGGVLARSEFLIINPGDTLTHPLTVRHDDNAISVIGSLNAENPFRQFGSDDSRSVLSATGRGYYVMGLLTPNHEPSIHALNDLRAVASRLEADGRKILLLFASDEDAARFDVSAFPGLPGNVTFGVDVDGVNRREILSSLHLDGATDPVFVIADSFNRIVWESTGYTIGIGDRLLSILSNL